MLLKPVNPSPVHTAIDITKDNEFSCEVVNNKNINSMFYIWNDEFGLIHQQYGTKKGSKLVCSLPANQIPNNEGYSWEATYWTPFDLTNKQTITVNSDVSKGQNYIVVGANSYCQGEPTNNHSWYKNGFYRMSEGSDIFRGRTYQYSNTEEGLQELNNEIQEGDKIIFYDAEGKALKSLNVYEIYEGYLDNWSNGEFTARIDNYY